MTSSELVERENALAKALCLLDTFAGEGLGHVYGNGQELNADDVCVELADAFGVEFEPGWYRKVASTVIKPLLSATHYAEVKSLNGQLRVLQESHDWMYGEKQRLENALKDIASRAHANLSRALTHTSEDV